MYILNQSGTEIHNSDFFERFCICVKDDAALIVSSVSRTTQPNTLGRYADKKEAQEILLELYTALHSGSRCYEMPQSRRRMEEPVVKDARVKRRGGS